MAIMTVRPVVLGRSDRDRIAVVDSDVALDADANYATVAR
jgi:hypothetical protein